MYGTYPRKCKEAFLCIFPITVIVILLGITITPLPLDILSMFAFGAILLTVGMGLFSLGIDMALTPMGEAMGISITRSRKLTLIFLICFLVGAIITAAEPDLQVLANQVPTIPNFTLILTVSVGVGCFLVIAILRILYKIPLRYMLLFFYLLVFLLASFTPQNFLAVAFDSGGVTTGPVTVPFILAMGVGMSLIRSDKDGHDDSFGLVALCSIGPILAVMILGICYQPTEAAYSIAVTSQVETSRDVAVAFFQAIPQYGKEVALAIVPIGLVFFLYNLCTRRFRARRLGSVCIGFLYTYLGLTIFLTGVNVGFLPAGYYLGEKIGAGTVPFLLIPLGMLIGYFMVMAEPSVHVLNKQVEEITNGAISQAAMNHSLCIGVAISAGLAMIRVVTGIHIFWFLIPGYLVAIALSFSTPKLFVGIAFDSGGVASGPMTATFFLPFAIGACQSLGGNLLTDAFGVVSMVAMTPLITIQVLWLLYKRKLAAIVAVRKLADSLPDTIVDYQQEVA
jgi:hypothetical protein